jgi:hypothetical protein
VSTFGYDPEVPAGFQEADLLQADYEAQSREHAALRRRAEAKGICLHGDGVQSYTPEFRPDLAPEGWACLDCEATFQNRAALEAAQDAARQEVECS